MGPMYPSLSFVFNWSFCYGEHGYSHGQFCGNLCFGWGSGAVLGAWCEPGALFLFSLSAQSCYDLSMLT